jgi:N-acetylmuramoyl-L-alanine amidase
MKKITRLVVHCSDSKWGDAEVIDKWHKERGWKGIGYHAVILNGKRSAKSEYDAAEDGNIEPGRNLNLDDVVDVSEVGAHAYGFNSRSIGICLIGKEQFTVSQFASALAFCYTFKKLIPRLMIIGHCEVSKKTCPNFDMDMFRFCLDQYPMKDYKIFDLFKKNI